MNNAQIWKSSLQESGQGQYQSRGGGGIASAWDLFLNIVPTVCLPGTPSMHICEHSRDEQV